MREMPYIEPYRIDGRRDGGRGILAVSYTHLTLPTTPYVEVFSMNFVNFLMHVEDVAVEVVEAVEVE